MDTRQLDSNFNEFNDKTSRLNIRVAKTIPGKANILP